MQQVSLHDLSEEQRSAFFAVVLDAGASVRLDGEIVTVDGCDDATMERALGAARLASPPRLRLGEHESSDDIGTLSGISRAKLAAALATAGIPFRVEGETLAYATEHRARVHAVLDGVMASAPSADRSVGTKKAIDPQAGERLTADGSGTQELMASQASVSERHRPDGFRRTYAAAVMAVAALGALSVLMPFVQVGDLWSQNGWEVIDTLELADKYSGGPMGATAMFGLSFVVGLHFALANRRRSTVRSMGGAALLAGAIAGVNTVITWQDIASIVDGTGMEIGNGLYVSAACAVAMIALGLFGIARSDSHP